MHHLHVLGLIETIFAANPGFGKFLQDAQVQCATETVAGHSKNGGIVLAPLVEHRLNSLCAIVIAEQDDPFRDILEALSAEGFNVGRNQVELNTPIKAIGLHKVVLHLHAEVEISIEVNVARSADEAERQAKGESLTSADAIYGVDEDALKPGDFFDPEADLDGEEA